MNPAFLIRSLAYLLIGILLGVGYLSTLSWNVRLYLTGASAWDAVVVHFVRLFATVVIFTVCALRGALPLLSSLVGFQIARTLSVRHKQHLPERES